MVDLSVFVWNLEDSDSDEPLIVLDGMGEIRDPALSTGGKVLAALSERSEIWNLDVDKPVRHTAGSIGPTFERSA